MKHVFLSLFLFCGFSIFAMNNDLETQYNEEISYSTIISLFDAIMSKNMYCTKDKQELMFSDYKSPMFLYCFRIKSINSIVNEVRKILHEGISEEDQRNMKNLINKLKTDPFNLTEEEITNIQTIRMYNFLIGKDLEKLDPDSKNRIMANRKDYQENAWKTQNGKIKREAKNYELFAPENPYVSLSEQIIRYKQKALNKKIN